MKKLIEVITPDKACEILKEYGFIMHPNHMRAGLAAGAYPFGVAFKMTENSINYTYEVYKSLLMEWIDKLSVEV